MPLRAAPQSYRPRVRQGLWLASMRYRAARGAVYGRRMTNQLDHAAPTDFVQRATALIPRLRERAREIETTRFLPSEIMAALQEAGLLRLGVPREYGGYESDPMTFLRVCEELATADASTAWCVFIHVTSTLALTALPQAKAKAMMADPKTVFSGVFAPRGQASIAGDDYVIRGRWAWGSGIRHAHWVSVGCMLRSEGAPARVTVFVPADRVRILDTWEVSGLCGTGSNDFVIEDYRAPAEHVAGPTLSCFADRPLYRFPRFGLLSSPIAAICLGLARAAIRELTTLAAAKVPDGTTRSLASRASTQIEVASAEAALRSAHAYFDQSIEAAHRAALHGEPTTSDRLHVRLATTHTVKTCADIVRSMYELAGGSALYSSAPIQRIFRDVHAATQHMMVSTATLELTGRLLLGVETDTTML